MSDVDKLTDSGSSHHHNWQTLEKETILEIRPWLRVVKDKVKLPSGTIVDDFYRFELPDYAIVCAVDSDGKLLLERMYKQCKGHPVLTCPAGGVEANETPLDTAKRELFEETGYLGRKWVELGSFMVDGTRGVCLAHMFIAQDIHKVALPENNEMERCEVHFLGWDDIEHKISIGELCLLPDIALLYRAHNRFPTLFTPK